jgi:tetratricopeptide (TPR) repeat protein
MNKTWKRNFIHAVVIGLFVILTFLPSLGAQFVNWDDQSHLTANRAVQTFNVREMFTQTVQKVYIPLTSLSFSVEHKLFGDGPFVYHLDNLLLHVGNTLLVYFLIQRLGATAAVAFWAALIFGVHPMRVESVAWVTERKDLLYAFFYLLALIAYVLDLQCRGLRAACGAPTRYFYVAMVCGLFSLLAKPMALSLPLILLLTDWFLKRPLDRRALFEKIPFAFYIIPIAWLTYSLHIRNPIVHPVDAALTWVWTFDFYLWKFFWPQVLVPVYHLPDHVGVGNPHYFWAGIFFAAFLLLTIRLRSHRWWLLAVGYYFLSIFFLLRFDTGHDINIVADRFMYLPSLGFCIVLGLMIENVISLGRHKSPVLNLLGASVTGLFILVLSVQSNIQTKVWNNTLTLWTYVIAHSPTEFLAYNDRAVGYVSLGFYDLAIDDYSSILKFDPHNVDAFYNRGLAYEKTGRFKAAIADFDEVIRQYPYYEKAHLHRGLTHEEIGDISAALADYNRTIMVSPDFPDGYLNRGNIYNKSGHLHEAFNDYNHAIALSPSFARALNNRGTVYAKLSDDTRALDDFNAAIAIDTSYAEAYYNRSVVLQRLNRIDQARHDVQKAQQLGVEVPADFLRLLK